MKTAQKRGLSLLLCIVLTITMLPVNVLAGTFLPVNSLSGSGSSIPPQLSAMTTDSNAGNQAGQSSANNAGSDMIEFNNPFGDVEPEDWFFEDVAFVFTSGLMTGTGTESMLFSPDMSMSRAMLVTVLYRLAVSPDTSGLTNTFTDVPENSWYSSAVKWAVANGITSGVGGNRFAPNSNVTREQAATFLLRYARLIGKGPADGETGSIDFADKDKISDWALEGVIWCSMVGIITGRPGDNGMLFDPQGNAIRAELAAMLHRFSDNVVNNSADDQPVPPADGPSSDSGSGSDPVDLINISFETNGGTTIPPISIQQGDTLPDVPVPIKDDYAFTGWYRDSSLTQPFFSDASVTESMTLYASYAKRDYNFKEYVDPVKFLPDCPINVSFDILSPESINDSNLNDYITIINKVNGNENPDVTVSSQGGNIYTISPRAPYTYTPGNSYELSLMKESLSFCNEKEEVRTMAFSIIKPETYIVQFKDGIVYLLWEQVNLIDDGVYTLTKALADEKGIAAGTTICLTDGLDSNGQGILNENSRISKVLGIVNTDSADPQRVMLLTEASRIEDIYDQLDLHWKESIDPETLANSIDVKKLEQDILASEGAMKLTNLLAVALNDSQTLASMLSSPDTTGFSALASEPLSALASGPASPFARPTENNDKVFLYINPSTLLQGLTVTASVGTATNTNFPDAVNNKWVVLTLNFNYNATIKTVQVKASFTFKEFITLSSGGNVGFNISELVYFDTWVDIYSQTDVEFDILVKTVDVNEEYLNITAEIQKLINNITKDNSEVPDVIREVLGSKGDYIDLLEVDLFEQVQKITPSTPVLEVKEKGTFVVRLNLAVGLSAQSTLMSASRIGIRGSIVDGLSTYKHELEGNGRQSLDLYCAGYLGVKAGIRLTVSVNFFGCEELGRVGLTGELGAYMDLYGFLQLHLLKTGGAHDINMNGGIYMEVGIYFELSIFAESKFFKAKAELSVLDLKFPFYTLGNRYVLYRFKNAGNTVIINQNDYYIGNSGLLDCWMLDLTTGDLVKGDYTILKNFYFEISNPFFLMIDPNDKGHIQIMPEIFGRRYDGVYVAAGTKRMDATVRLYYGGDNLCFSSREKGYTYNEIKLIWLDPSIRPEDVNLNPVNATYIVNVNRQKAAELTKTVLSGSVPGSIDLTPWLEPIEGLSRYQGAVVTGYVGNWDAAIWEDATYIVNIEKLQALVSYIYIHDGQWHYDVYAIEKGDKPPFPSDYKSPGPERTFNSWLRRDYTFIDYSYKTTENKEEELTNRKLASAWAAGLTYTGYDKTQAVYTFTGTLEECNEKFNENQKTIPVLYHNVAQYDTNRVLIKFIYPSMEYTAYGQNFNIPRTEEEFYFDYGTIPIPPRQKSYPGCTIYGWSSRYTNIADYDYDSLPLAKNNTYYNLIVGFSERRIIFKTDTGTFTDGSTTADSGMIPYPDYQKFVEDFHNANNISTIQPVLKDGVLHKFHHWVVDYSQDSQGIQTWNAVWVAAPDQKLTVAFKAGEGGAFPEGGTSVTLEFPYGTRMNLSSFSPFKDPDNRYYYTLSGWRDPDGNTYGLTDDIVIQKNMTYTALYTQTDRIYTITLSAGDGMFSDGETIKTFTGKYDEATNISETVGGLTPPAGNAVYHYEFDGWSEALPEVFTQDMTITARYRQVENEYTITFNAGSGSFEGGATIVTQTYHYGDTIIPPVDPGKAEGEAFRFEFSGWIPSLAAGETVTGSRTYTATYRSVPKDGTVTGITVTDGEVTEDICVGSISGYTYEIVEAFDGNTAPVLTITGNGLTFSGTARDIYVRIVSTASSITFNNLNISTDKNYFECINVAEDDTPLTINIEGNCAFEIEFPSDEAQNVMRIERPTQFTGTNKAEDSLHIGTSGGRAVYFSNSLTFVNLALSIDASGDENIDKDIIYALNADVGVDTQYMCCFVNSDITIYSDGSGLVIWPISLEIQSSVLTMNCNGPAGFLGRFVVSDSNVTIAAEQGLWIFGEASFSGASQIRLTAEDGAAISATNGISVPEDYDLGGTSIQLLTDSSADEYYTFADKTGDTWIPAAIVEINYP